MRPFCYLIYLESLFSKVSCFSRENCSFYRINFHRSSLFLMKIWTLFLSHICPGQMTFTHQFSNHLVPRLFFWHHNLWVEKCYLHSLLFPCAYLLTFLHIQALFSMHTISDSRPRPEILQSLHQLFIWYYPPCTSYPSSFLLGRQPRRTLQVPFANNNSDCSTRPCVYRVPQFQLTNQSGLLAFAQSAV